MRGDWAPSAGCVRPSADRTWPGIEGSKLGSCCESSASGVQRMSPSPPSDSTGTGLVRVCEDVLRRGLFQKSRPGEQ